MGKKYFLTDAELENSNEDYFNINDLKKNIFKILENNEKSYNIAIIGKWGLGKSSLINMVKSELKNKDNYKVIEINAWKYEKETLARVFLRQVLLALGIEKKTTAEMFNSEIKECLRTKSEHSDRKSSIFSILWDIFWNNKLFVAIVFVLSVILYGIYKAISLRLVGLWGQVDLHFFMRYFTGYCRNVGVIFLLPLFLSLIAMALERLKDRENSVGVTYPTPGVEDYEILLERRLKDFPETKMIVVLDDLDRLSSKKMVEALDAIKVFINYNNFIFIVPFDDEILKKSMRDVNVQNEVGVLDKLFQFKLYLPPLYVDNIKDYAADLCRNGLIDFIDDYCNGNVDEIERTVRNIIIYSEVETPRQVKKLVNAFVNNQMVAYEREKNGKAGIGFASSLPGIHMIAKLSVLQADFNEFFDLLLNYPEAMDIVLQANKNRELIPEMPDEIQQNLKVYREEKDDDIEWNFDKKNIPLINYLSQTAQYQVDTIESYLYMTMDDIAIKAGSKKQKEFLKMVTSGNVTGALDAFRETPEVFESATRLLKRTSDIEEMKHIIVVLIYMIKEFNQEQMELAVDSINIRGLEFAQNMTEADEDEIDYENLLIGYKASDYSDNYLKILQTCINSTNQTQVFQKLQAYMDNIEWFDGEILSSIQKYINWVLKNDLIEPLEFWILKERFRGSNIEWMETYYKYLVRQVVEKNNRDEKIYTELPEAFNVCATAQNASDLWFMLEDVFADETYAKLFLNTVRLDQERRLTDEDISAAINKQISVEDCDFDSINNMILLCNYEPDDVEAYCGYISSQSDKVISADLILSYTRKHETKDIQPAIVTCVEEALVSPDIECATNFEKLIELYDATTRKKIIDIFTRETKYVANAQHKYLELQKQYGLFAKYYWDEAEMVVSKMFEYNSQYTINLSYAYLIVKYAMEAYVSFDENLKSKYFEVLKSFALNSSLVGAGIYGFLHWKDALSESNFMEIEKALTPAIDDENCYDICKIYNKNEIYITSNNKNLHGYIEANINVIENAISKEKIEWALQNLRRKYISISEESYKRLYLATLKLESDTRGSACRVLAYFLDNCNSVSLSKNAIWMLKQDENNVAYSIMTLCERDKCKEITDYILKNQSEFDVSDILPFLRYLQSNPGDKMQHSRYLLTEMAVKKCSDISERTECVDFMKSTSSKERGKYGKLYAEILQKMYVSESDDSLREKIFKLAKRWRVKLSE